MVSISIGGAGKLSGYSCARKNTTVGGCIMQRNRFLRQRGKNLRDLSSFVLATVLPANENF